MSSRPVTVADREEAGFFGKIPRLGDFVSRGLSRGCVAQIDEWLQYGMAELREVDGWRETYAGAPVWRFLIPRGQWSEVAFGGVLVASVDRVGRHYPLVACLPLESAQTATDPQRTARQADCLARELIARMRRLEAPETLLQALHDCRAAEPDAATALPAVLRMFSPEGSRSAWWSVLSPEQPFLEVAHRGKPDATLFLRLLGP